MTEPGKAVFISYASEDVQAALRLCSGLRAAGVEVWLDQSELVGGDAWEAKIKKQIQTCALFVPLISANTQTREEGYFRREWNLAVNRTLDMVHDKTFLLPVVIDATADAAARVPEKFREVQWTRLPGGETTPAFVGRVKHLLGLESGTGVSPVKTGLDSHAAPIASPGRDARATPNRHGMPRWIWAVAAAAVVGGIVRFRSSRGSIASNSKPQTQNSEPAPTARAPAKSIAVLPFANLSTEKENEFFADGVHDDIITNLAKIRDLTVISRTSVLAYRDTASRNMKKIAAELGVANVVEGSVRRVGNKVHMNAQLIDARTDAHLWADTFDGDTSDIFALQARLAREIAGALKATLTPGERTQIEKRPTQNQVAYDLFVRAKLQEESLTPRSSLGRHEQAVALYEQAIDADPEFTLAQSRLTKLHAIMYFLGALDPSPERRARAEAAATAVQRIAPGSPEAHYAAGVFAYNCEYDYPRALTEYRAAEIAWPNDPQLLTQMGQTFRRLGEWGQARNHFERAAALNPRDLGVGYALLVTLNHTRRYPEALVQGQKYSSLFPGDADIATLRIRAQFALDGDRTSYLRALATRPAYDTDPYGLRGAYERAFFADDFGGADRALSDSRISVLPMSGQGTADPVALHRAMLAWLTGRTDVARGFAEEAMSYYRERTWTGRLQNYASIGIARALAYAGKGADSSQLLRGMFEPKQGMDAFDRVFLLLEASRIYVAIGQREEALKVLRELMTGACQWSPNEFRLDPFWSRLKDDPRFEEILKSAKPL